MKKLLLLSVCAMFFTCGAINSSAQRNMNHILNHLKSDSVSIPKKIILPNNSGLAKQKPSAINSRIKAIVTSDYNGVYKKEDSFSYLWNGNKIPDFSGSFLLEEMHEANSIKTFHVLAVNLDFWDESRVATYIERILNYDTILKFNYDEGISNFNSAPYEKSYHEFNASGQSIKHTSFEENGGNLELNSQLLVEYDASGKLISDTYRERQAGSWLNSYRGEISYTNNQISSFLDHEWDGNQWKENLRYLLEYYPNSNWKSETLSYKVANQWKNDEKRTFIFNSANQRIEEIYQEWDGNNWENIYKVEYTYNSNGQMAQLKASTWVELTSKWSADYELITFSYDAQNRNEMMQLQSYVDGILENFLKYDYQYANNNLESVVISQWSVPQDAYSQGLKMEMQYNSFDQLTLLKYAEKNPGGFWEDIFNKFEIYYEEFEDGLPSSIEGVKESKVNFSLYPNPAQEYIEIKVQDEHLSTVQISDITGKVVLQKQIPNKVNKHKLSIEHLPNGLYLLQLNANHKQGTRSFIIQR